MHKLLITTTLALGCTLLVAASGCDDDEETPAGTGGVAGTAGSAGRGGTAGTGTGGTAGTGTGGTGTGGTGTGGTGTGGTGGTADSGADTGTDAGTDAGPAAVMVTCPASGTTDITAGGPPFAFAPTTATVAVNGIVKFTNSSASPIEHTATSGAGGVTPSPDGRWDTGDIDPAESICMRFQVAGTYPFYCKYHSVMMQGTITVQ